MDTQTDTRNADDELLLKGFQTAAWPFDRWHHREHIKIAYLYLRQFPFPEALEKLRAGIKAYNAAHQVPEEPTRGYHETMTQAWLRLVHFVLCEYGPAENAESFLELHPELAGKKVLRLFYTSERFMSPQAKVEYLEPDLTPLPVSSKSQRLI